MLVFLYFGFLFVLVQVLGVFLEVKKEGDGECEVVRDEGQLVLHPMPGFSLGWRISGIRNGETLPRVAQSSVPVLPGATAGLWAGGRAGIAAWFKSALNGSSEAWLVPGWMFRGGAGSVGMGMGMAPTFQCPGEGRSVHFGFSFPGEGEAEPSCSQWLCPGLGSLS